MPPIFPHDAETVFRCLGGDREIEKCFPLRIILKRIPPVRGAKNRDINGIGQSMVALGIITVL